MSAGQRIRLKREELGMTQDELAKILGYKSRSSVNKVENTRDLSLKLVNQYAKALGCSATYLLGWDDDSSAPTERHLDAEVAIHDVNIVSAFSNLSDDDIQIVRKFSKLSASKKQIVNDLINSLLNNE